MLVMPSPDVLIGPVGCKDESGRTVWFFMVGTVDRGKTECLHNDVFQEFTRRGHTVLNSDGKKRC